MIPELPSMLRVVWLMVVATGTGDDGGRGTLVAKQRRQLQRHEPQIIRKMIDVEIRFYPPPMVGW